jgi:hypothetical protein
MARDVLARAMGLAAHDWLTSTQSNRRRNPAMRLTTITHHITPFAAVAGGILVLLMPRLLNYIIAIYLILVGVVGLNGLYHFVR